MDIGALLKTGIYIISTSMLYPALFLLAAGFVVVVASLGAFIAEWGERKRVSRKFQAERRFALLGSGEYAGMMGKVLEDFDEILRAPGTTWNDIENLWRIISLKQWKRLDYLRILARLGPAMGLVCTLIPMSTGLAAMSQGDMTRLSSDLVVAFSTTVVGLCFGVTAHVLYIVRARWLEGDLETVQFEIEARATRILNERERKES